MAAIGVFMRNGIQIVLDWNIVLRMMLHFASIVISLGLSSYLCAGGANSNEEMEDVTE